MNASTATKRIFLSGQLVELWEHPDVFFGWTREHLDQYVERGAWVLLFNAFALAVGRPEPAYGC